MCILAKRSNVGSAWIPIKDLNAKWVLKVLRQAGREKVQSCLKELLQKEAITEPVSISPLVACSIAQNWKVCKNILDTNIFCDPQVAKKLSILCKLWLHRHKDNVKWIDVYFAIFTWTHIELPMCIGKTATLCDNYMSQFSRQWCLYCWSVSEIMRCSKTWNWTPWRTDWISALHSVSLSEE